MVLSVCANVKDIAQLGRFFPWSKPACCPCCGSVTLWWHGFAPAYFSSLAEPVYIRRLLCPACRAVHRLKPAGYFPRFRSSIQEIRDSIAQRTMKNRWRPDLPRPRQRQWWRRLGRMITLVLGISFTGSSSTAFTYLMEQHIIPVTGAELPENRTM